MTTPDQDQSNDPELARLYRESARELPSAAADAEILAAAHRAVGSTPRRLDRPFRNWGAPLFAAATIAIVAVGIVRMIPPDQVAAPRAEHRDTAGKAKETSTAPGASSNAPTSNENQMVPASPPNTTPMPAEPQAAAAPPPRANASLRPPQRNKPSAQVEQLPPAPAVAAAPPKSVQPEAADALNKSTAAQSAPPPNAFTSMQARPRTAPGGVRNEEDPVKWIEMIRELRNQGQVAAATRELRAFKLRYPDYELPADLQDK